MRATPKNPEPGQLHESLAAGSLLLTATRRLARHLALAHARWQSSRGARAWESPRILTWTAWQHELWNDSRMQALGRGERPSMLLSAGQSLALWETIVAEWNEDRDLLLPTALARYAQDAWTLLHQWNLEQPRGGLSEEAQAFARWAKEFQDRCKAHHWIDEAALTRCLTERVIADEIAAPPELWLSGFDELSPGQQALLTALQDQGGVVHRLSSVGSAEKSRRIGLPHAAAEIAAAARWVRALLEKHQLNHNIMIGLVVPDLAGRRQQLERGLREALAPGDLYTPGDDPSTLFNISLGSPLVELPLIHTALQLLALRLAPLAFLPIADLLNSPFWAGAEQERDSRARLDLRLREEARPAMTAAALAEAAGRPGASHCPQLVRAIGAAVAVTASDKQSPSGWSKTFADWLKLLDWPGERSLSSAEFQAAEAWHDLLVEFAALDPVWPSLSAGKALRELQRLAASRPFQPGSPDAPVQVLGVLEAADLRFDYLWVMGLDDESWPGAPDPNPLIPIDFQRKHGLPRSSAERELAYARRLTERLLASADTVILSYPLAEGERALRASPLLDGLAEIDLEQLPQAVLSSPRQQPATVPPMEIYTDDLGPKLDDPAAIRGGSRLIQDQAACPFRAFANHRLGAVSPAVPQVGVDALIRGNLVHETLHVLWGDLGTQRRLMECSDHELKALIARAVKQALAKHKRRQPELWGRRRSQLEAERLSALMLEWLALERQRSDFTVLASEAPRELTLGPLQIHMRIDRADRLADGTVALIDYKTGNRLRTADWDGERPVAPQLPLYALTEGETLGAVLYAKLRKGECGYLGRLSENTQLYDNIDNSKKFEAVPDWAAPIEQWRQILTSLAQNFCQGAAEVDPLPGACDHCDLHALCRIHALSAGEIAVSQDEQDGYGPTGIPSPLTEDR